MPDKQPTAPNPSAASRRSLTALLATLPASMSLGAVPALAAATGEGADAELIRLCDAYIRAVDDVNKHKLEWEHCPYWKALLEIEAQLEPLEATTLAGIVAMARVAQHLARQPDGSEDWGETNTGDWPMWVTQAVLRLLPPAA